MQRKITKIMANDLMQALRQARGITMEELAEITQLTVTTIYNYEHGKCGARHYNAKAIADALGCDIKDIFDWVKVESHYCGNNQKRKLNEKQVREIRDYYSNGIMSCTQLAEKYGMTYGMIQRICSGQSWKEVD